MKSFKSIDAVTIKLSKYLNIHQNANKADIKNQMFTLEKIYISSTEKLSLSQSSLTSV